MFTPILYALSGSNFSEDYDPSRPTFIQNPTIETQNAGSCALEDLVTSAVVRVQWKWYNRNDELYEAKVELHNVGYPTLPVLELKEEGTTWGIAFPTPTPTWARGDLTENTEFGDFTFTGMVEIEQSTSKGKSRTKGGRSENTDWIFALSVIQKSDGANLGTYYLPWRRTYATC